ncbi:heterogeneous nuclear ribonucleoprotein L-like [Tetranychus urticae]|nr:heterogeneous nuclear ribonucleoprotein L-like [Tetranychus urticae]
MYGGHKRKANYDNYYYYQGPGGEGGGHRMDKSGGYRDDRENHVLLITVINPAFPITCEIIHKVCDPIGKVLRVVIFKKNGVQAMVEFDTIESAKKVKSELHGCDIYTGCCTLRIEYAKPTRLNVYKNDSESFDFTKPNMAR